MEAVNRTNESIPGSELGAGRAPDPARVVLRYDRDSDTLIVHFYGTAIPAVSLLQPNDWYVRWDRLRSRPVGVQIEGFLAHEVKEDPSLLDALDAAELRDITRDEVERIRERLVGARPGREPAADVVARLLPRFWRAAIEATEPDPSD